LRVVEILAERKEATSPRLMDELGLAQSSVHEHLAMLREAEIVQASGEGLNWYYCLDPAAIDDLGTYLGEIGQRARIGTER
jgi:DNA-binding IclR family transcriptional regulator